MLLVTLALVGISGSVWASKGTLFPKPTDEPNAGTSVITSSNNRKKISAVPNSNPTNNTGQPSKTANPQAQNSTQATLTSPKTISAQSGNPATVTNGSGTSTSGNTSGSSSSSSSGASSGCIYNSQPAPCIGGSTTGASGWGTPVFDDEFNGASLDTTVWNTENGWSKNGITVSTTNETVSNGILVLTLASSSSGAEISTNNYGLPVGGFAEARIYFPGTGTTIFNWPAWWVSGSNWPVDGEADIFEGLGTATTNYHYYSGGNKQSGPFDIPGTWSNAFHTYGLYRGSGHNDIYWDGTLVKTYTTADSGAAENLILTNGCSGSCTPGAQVKVDYVRTWN